MAADFKIISFNIQKFGRSSMLHKDLTSIARVIKNNKVDIVGIKEITNKEALKGLRQLRYLA